MVENPFNKYLSDPCNPEKIINLSNEVFVEGHLEKLDDLIVAILPLANIVYYKSIKYLDDREYAKEDLISDAVLRLYQDMKLRWDKYIHIDSYYTYFSTILRNGMIGLVHGYHNFYSIVDLDPENVKYDSMMEDAYEDVEVDMLRDSIKKEILKTAKRILNCRKVNTKLLLGILELKYEERTSLSSLRSRVRVLGISTSLFDFYCEHVDYVYKLSFNYHYAMLGERTKMTDRITDIIGRFEDVTYKMLSVNYYDSIIPEIYAEFGPDIARKFVKTFSNRTVHVPDYRDFCDNLLGGVVLALADNNKDNLYEVAEEYGIPYRSLSRIYNKAIKFDE